MLYPNKLKKLVLACVGLAASILVLTRALPEGNGRSLQTQKSAPPSCPIPNF